MNGAPKRTRALLGLIAICLAALAAAGCTAQPATENLSQVKAVLRNFVMSGDYAAEIATVAGDEAAWDLRVGIHMGPVVAGVIGRKQYVFDLWGDTVNVASRIAAEAEPASVLTSAPVWRSLCNGFRGSSKGLVELKGKGDLELIQCHQSV